MKPNDNRPAELAAATGSVSVSADEYVRLEKCAKAIAWLGSQGVCWRNADLVDNFWTIGPSTEWLYHRQSKPSLEDEVLRHASVLTPNAKVSDGYR